MLSEKVDALRLDRKGDKTSTYACSQKANNIRRAICQKKK